MTESDVDEKARKAAEKEAERERKAAEKAIEKERKAAERAAEKERKAAEKQAEKERKAAEREANRMPEQNDVRMPKPGTSTRAVWDICDKISQTLKQAAPRAQVIEAGEEAGINRHTILTQYNRWRKFHGVEGRVTAPQKEAS